MNRIIDEAVEQAVKDAFQTMVRELSAATADSERVKIGQRFRQAVETCEKARAIAEAVTRSTQYLASNG